jgi:hypothetical protein
VAEEPVPISPGLSSGTFDNRGNRTIFLWQFKPYLYKNGSHIWTHCLTTVTTIGGIKMETMVSSLLQLNNETNTVLLNNARKV